MIGKLILVEWKDPYYEQTNIDLFEEIENIKFDKLNCKTFGFLTDENEKSICVSIMKYRDDTYKYNYRIPKKFISKTHNLFNKKECYLKKISESMIGDLIKINWNDSVVSRYIMTLEEIKEFDLSYASICGFLLKKTDDEIIITEKIVDKIHYNNIHIFKNKIIDKIEIFGDKN